MGAQVSRPHRVATSTGATTVTVAPTTLTFATQTTGSTSSPQAVQLTNIGSASLTISSISTTGANAGDFALQNNPCGPGLGLGASCQLGVTFTPTGMGARQASISITDNATASPQMVTLNGTAPDFSMSSGTATTATVSAGQTANYTIAVAPSGGFNQNVLFSRSGNPALTVCTVSPNPLSMNGTSAANATLTISTTAPSKGFILPLRITTGMPANYDVGDRGLVCPGPKPKDSLGATGRAYSHVMRSDDHSGVRWRGFGKRRWRWEPRYADRNIRYYGGGNFRVRHRDTHCEADARCAIAQSRRRGTMW